ncbi:MAG: GIY-YIG nuclease family protein, partial [Pricia sp.]|nr:GIY-YIG nuclease family protein [Pricia sp.]
MIAHQIKSFALVDVTTSGKGIRNNRIIEIGIIRFENDAIVDKLVSLINPDQSIPEYVTASTGIDNEMIYNAPLFADLADRIDEITRNAVFVAHGASFAYHVLSAEFRDLDHEFTRPKLCSNKLAKKLMPRMFSYRLEHLCGVLGIPLSPEHRSESSIEANATLFQRLLALDEGLHTIEEELKPKKNEVSPRSHIESRVFSSLPTGPGVYKFQDEEGETIYIGKAKNIKKRVLSHFRSRSEKESLLCRETFSIDFEITGSELIALLLEADLIRKHLPKRNTVQKKSHRIFHIQSYTNKQGILQLTIEDLPSLYVPSEFFFTKGAAKKKLESLCKEFDLCPKYTGLQRKKGRCKHVLFPDCRGVCCGEESSNQYNLRARMALAKLKTNTDTYVIQNRGRITGEHSFVLVLDGIYQGFGYFDGSQQICTISDMLDLI